MMELKTSDSWLQLVSPKVEIRLGKVRQALFDFDGTLSLIRQGWETVMIPLMVEMISGSEQIPASIEAEVQSYVDRSTGTLTIKQMRWLEEAVHRYGYSKYALTAWEYKAIYNQRLLERVKDRLKKVKETALGVDCLMLAGAEVFLKELSDKGVRLYLASGSDHPYVLEEAHLLGIDGYFEGRIYGARMDSEDDSKELVIQRILDMPGIHPDELLVVGDGPVEIRFARAAGALALGVASDEINRCGWNEKKRRRLMDAGADMLIADFNHHAQLASLLAARGSSH